MPNWGLNPDGALYNLGKFFSSLNRRLKGLS